MTEVINLRLVRKRKQREDAERQAASNRSIHGRTRAEKNARKAERIAQDRHLDGHRRTIPDE
jgi:hypothetical protein